MPRALAALLLILVSGPASAQLAWRASSLPAGDQPFDLVAIDLDADGDVDLAVTDSKADSVSLFRNDGAGAFAARSALASGRFPRGITAADLDGDGRVDLAVSATAADAVAIHAGLGDGRFAPARLVPAGGRPFHLTAADLDGDGDADLAVPDEARLTTLLTNDGSGEFRATTYDTGERPSNAAAVDWNRDGRVDLAVTNWASKTVTLLQAAGPAGAFAPPRPLSADGRGLFGICVGDLDRDGSPDLAVNDIERNAFQVLYGDGRGGVARSVLVPAGPGVRSVQAADLDGDGWLDLVGADTAAGCVSVALADGRGGFAAPQQVPVGVKPRVARVADFDGDGRLDVAVTNMESDSVTVLFNQGRGGTVDGEEVGPPLAARSREFTGLEGPAGVALALDGAVLVADPRQHRVALVPADGGPPRTIAGTGVAGFSGDGGPAAAAQLAAPFAVAVAADGSIYIADFDNHRLRRIDARGAIATIAGTGEAGTGEAGAAGDGGPAVAARLTRPFSLALAAARRPPGDGRGAGDILYIAELQTGRVRRIGPDGRIDTVAGSGAIGTGGDGGPATAAALGPFLTIAADAAGRLIIADQLNGRVRMVDRDGIIRTVAAALEAPTAVAVDGDGDIIVAVRGGLTRLAPDGRVSLLATLPGPSGAPGLAIAANGDVMYSAPAAHAVQRLAAGSMGPVGPPAP